MDSEKIRKKGRAGPISSLAWFVLNDLPLDNTTSDSKTLVFPAPFLPCKTFSPCPGVMSTSSRFLMFSIFSFLINKLLPLVLNFLTVSLFCLRVYNLYSFNGITTCLSFPPASLDIKQLLFASFNAMTTVLPSIAFKASSK